MWTQFWDMHSGGSQKEKWHKIYIEAPEVEAKIIFYNRFKHNPERVTCTCCGEDYSISENESLEQLTAYHRGCNFDKNLQKYSEEKNEFNEKFLTLDEYKKDKNILFIFKNEINENEKIGDVPDQGYVWVE